MAALFLTVQTIQRRAVGGPSGKFGAILLAEFAASPFMSTLFKHLHRAANRVTRKGAAK